MVFTDEVIILNILEQIRKKFRDECIDPLRYHNLVSPSNRIIKTIVQLNIRRANTILRINFQQYTFLEQ